jgi:hypothetical protein
MKKKPSTGLHASRPDIVSNENLCLAPCDGGCLKRLALPVQIGNYATHFD